MAKKTEQKSDNMRFVNRAELSAMMGVAPTTIDKWIKSGCPYIDRASKKRGISWKFDIPAVVKWREQIIAESFSDTASIDIDEAKRRKLLAEAEIAEIQLQKEKGEVIPIKEITDAVTKEYAAVKVAVLAIPNKASPMVVGLELNEINKILTKYANEALTRLTYDQQFED